MSVSQLTANRFAIDHAGKDLPFRGGICAPHRAVGPLTGELVAVKLRPQV